MAILHNKNFLEKKIDNNLDKLDCWYVHYAAGDIFRIFEICPKEVKWCAFERGVDKSLKFYKLDRIRRLIYGGRK
tara:strand:- start:2148 stop:2372 length:225 start_codon:yes stop_codon:yes gene_type:complete